MTLPKPPHEPPPCTNVELLAPGFRRKLLLVIAKMKARGWNPVITETLRTNERQAFLYGFGRDYDDGRGVVTAAPTNARSWHGFGLAADLKSGDHEWDDTPEDFWTALADCARAENLTTGADWRAKDKPHVQHWTPGMRASPSPLALQLQEDGGNQRVWEVLHATD